MTHFIQYIPRHIVTRLPNSGAAAWFSRQQPAAAGFYVPELHVAAADAVASKLKSGDTVWVIGQLHGPQGAARTAFLPVALDARIDVDAVHSKTEAGIDIVPAATSRYFRLADATPVLARLSSITATGKTTALMVEPGVKVGNRFQGMRRLAEQTPLEAWARRLETEPYDFVSYRHADGTHAAFEHVRQLMLEEGRIVFWDRWGLPRRLSERRELVSDEALDAHLLRVLGCARRVWGVESPSYRSEGSYALKEAELAESQGKFEPVPWSVGFDGSGSAKRAVRDPWRVVRTASGQGTSPS